MDRASHRMSEARLEFVKLNEGPEIVQMSAYTEQQKVFWKSKSVFFETQKKSKETKVPKAPAFVETMLSQDTAEWPFPFLLLFTKPNLDEYKQSQISPASGLRKKPKVL